MTFAKCAAVEQLISYVACKLLAVHFSPVNIGVLHFQQAEVQDKSCAHVCRIDMKETLEGKLTWVVFQSAALV